MKVVISPVYIGMWPFVSEVACTVSLDSSRISRTYNVEGLSGPWSKWDLTYDGKRIKKKLIEIKTKLKWLPQIRIISPAIEITRDGDVIATIKLRHGNWRHFDFDCNGKTFEFTNSWWHPFQICQQLDMKVVKMNTYTFNDAVDELDPDAIAMLCMYWRQGTCFD